MLRHFKFSDLQGLLSLNSHPGGRQEVVFEYLHQLDTSRAHYRIRVSVLPVYTHSLREMKRNINQAGHLIQCRGIDCIRDHASGVNQYKMPCRLYLRRWCLHSEDSIRHWRNHGHGRIRIRSGTSN